MTGPNDPILLDAINALEHGGVLARPAPRQGGRRGVAHHLVDHLGLGAAGVFGFNETFFDDALADKDDLVG